MQVLISPFVSFNPYPILELESWKSVARNTTVCEVVDFIERHLHKLKFWISIAWYVKKLISLEMKSVLWIKYLYSLKVKTVLRM